MTNSLKGMAYYMELIQAASTGVRDESCETIGRWLGKIDDEFQRIMKRLDGYLKKACPEWKALTFDDYSGDEAFADGLPTLREVHNKIRAKLGN
jgi:hypothetical protein